MSQRVGTRLQRAEARLGRALFPKYTCTGCLATPSTRRSLSSSQRCNEGNGQADFGSQDRAIRTRRAPRARRIFSLIQPTGIPHLGNYLGAIRSWKDFQDQRISYEGGEKRKHVMMYGIADLHSLTGKQTPQDRSNSVRQTFASLLALGLDPDISTLFVQSQVPAHPELMWILSNIASTGYLSRMTQWKDKMGLEDPQSTSRQLGFMGSLDEKSQERLKLSLFSYPVLQAADILLYVPDSIPVGEDQAQHVEFTRAIARSFNSTYIPKGEAPILRTPELLLSPAKRIMSLQDPNKKMSKSDPDPSSRILITDEPEDIKMKFKKAKTDSIAGPITYSPTERPGVSNLIDIYKHVQRSPKSQTAIAIDLQDVTLGALKSLVAEAVILELRGVREKYLALMEEGDVTVDEAMMKGQAIMRNRAGHTMRAVRKAVGLYDPVEHLKAAQKRARTGGNVADEEEVLVKEDWQQEEEEHGKKASHGV